jgi:hypothetical protein
MGDPDYCVLHIDCELAFKPTIRGEIITPLLSRSTVDSEMRTNPEKARREYYCQFTTEAGADAIVKRGVITRNEEVRKPLHYNDTGKKRFGFFYDPARQYDNSIVLGHSTGHRFNKYLCIVIMVRMGMRNKYSIDFCRIHSKLIASHQSPWTWVNMIVLAVEVINAEPSSHSFLTYGGKTSAT